MGFSPLSTPQDFLFSVVFRIPPCDNTRLPGGSLSLQAGSFQLIHLPHGHGLGPSLVGFPPRSGLNLPRLTLPLGVPLPVDSFLFSLQLPLGANF